MSVDRFLSYLPIDRRWALAGGPPVAERSPGAALFADIAGYTALTEAFVRERGTLAGADAMTSWLNRAYDGLIAEVHARRGVVIGFSGDAITCWFPEDDGARALAAAFAMRAFAGALEAPPGLPPDAASLTLTTVAVTGLGRRLVVGAEGLGRHEVLAGPPVSRLARLADRARSGELLFETEAGAPILKGLSIEALAASETEDGDGADAGDAGRRRVRVLAAPPAPEVEPWPPAASWPRTLGPEDARGWMIRAVYERLIEQRDDWLAELRRGVALFLRFPLPEVDASDFEQRLSGFVEGVQRILSRTGGQLIQLTVGEKGSYLYACFGAPISHDDDHQRAASAARALLLERPPELGDGELQIGLAQGLLRAGAYGGEARRTYGALGDAANTAARLMSRAPAGQALLPRKLAEQLRPPLRTTDHASLTLKGKTEPLATSLLTLDDPRSSRRARTFEAPAAGAALAASRVLGRDSELAEIAGALQRGLDGRGAAILIEAQAGMGKSALVAEVGRLAAALGAQALLAGADSVETETAWFAWRGVVSALLDLPAELGDLEALRAQITARLPEAQRPRAALLEAVLPLGWPEDAATRELAAEARADSLRELLIALLSEATRSRPLVLVIEDVHWLDSASWGMLRLAAQELDALSLILTTRPLPGEAPEALRDILSAEVSAHILLEGLRRPAIRGLLERALGAAEVPAELVRFVLEKAEGHPFFSEELAYALRDGGRVRIVKGRCELTEEGLVQLDMPDTVQGLVTSRIDTLELGPLMTLKVASVLGRRFALPMVQEIHPSEDGAGALEQQLATLTTRELIRPPEESQGSYSFKHAITQLAVYNLMLEAQRQRLHRAAALWIERTYAGELSSVVALLAHHWACVIDASPQPEHGDVGRAVLATARAGEQALRSYANQEGTGFLERALSLAGDDEQLAPRQRRAEWHQQLGEAYYGMGQMADARRHLRAALQLLGFTPPRSQTRRFARILTEGGRQLLRQLRPVATARASQRRDTLLTGMRTFRPLGAIAILQANSLEAADIALMLLRLGEELGTHPELAAAYAYAGVLAALVPLPRLARRYNARCLEVAAAFQGDPALTPVYLMLGMQHSSLGNWDSARTSLQSGVEVATEIGYRRRWEECRGLLAMVDSLTGRLAAGFEGWRAVQLSGRRRGDVQSQVWGVCGQVEVELKRGGRFTDERGQALLADAEALLSRELEAVSEVRIRGLLALIHERRGEAAAALAQARSGARVMTGTTATLVFLFEGWAGVCRILVHLLGRGQGEPADEALLGRAFVSLRALAKVFPVARPRVWLCEGLELARRGRLNKARARFQRALALARALAMPYDEGLCLLALARRAGLPEADAAREAEAAERILASLGGRCEVEPCDAPWP